MYQRFNFKGLDLTSGDVVAILARSFPLEFEAAVVGVRDNGDTLEVISTQIAILQHSGLFPTDDVIDITMVSGYEEAVPLYAHAPLVRGQICEVGGYRATVTAAFDGIVTGKVVDPDGPNDGHNMTGGSSYWKALDTVSV